jgi:K+-sensing histidine kinase KdpD
MLDAAIARRPAIAIVDELAPQYTRLKNRKRWDVMDFYNAGIR